MDNNRNTDTATLGAGCFWCVEAIFDQLKGVESVEVGYSGGKIKNPTYKEVCAGHTGHVEVARVIFDPDLISYSQLLEIFFLTHDPTTLNRQGADVGEQYRSVIFYHNENQKIAARQVKDTIDASGEYDKPIVTAIEPLKNYYKAENYHQEYFENNQNQPYCKAVIQPKLKKFRNRFNDQIKESK